MAGFADWRDGGRTGDDVAGQTESRGPVTWWNPSTWSNSYLFDPTPAYIAPLDRGEKRQELKEEGRYLYKRDLGGDGEQQLTPLQRHAEWLKDRPKAGESDTIFGYDRDEVLQSAADNEGLDITMFRDAILLEAAEQYFNKSESQFQYESPIGPPGPPPPNFFTEPAGGSGSGGRGGPKYVAPDRRQVEEYVGDKMIVLTGKRQPELGKFVDKYLAAAKAAFEGKSIDPASETLENIRGLAEYKRIHTLRAEGTDENTWVNRRTQRLEQLGMGSGAAAARGIELAATGATLANIDIGKAQTARGRKDITLFNRLEKVAAGIGSRL